MSEHVLIVRPILVPGLTEVSVILLVKTIVVARFVEVRVGTVSPIKPVVEGVVQVTRVLVVLEVVEVPVRERRGLVIICNCGRVSVLIIVSLLLG